MIWRNILIAAVPLLGLGLLPTAIDAAPPVASTASTALPVTQIVAMRRLSEGQYRSTIADIFGPNIRVSGRFEPVVRPVHELIASSAREAALSPAGLEQFDAMARGIAAQVFAPDARAVTLDCEPKDQAAADAACAQTALTGLGRYLFRRPLTAAEAAFYTGVATKAAAQTGSFYKGMELALAGMLVAPQFLYLVESAEADPDHPGALRLDNYSRASRLAFVLWNSTPNRALLDAAAHGDLTDAVKLDTTVQHMVQSPRFEQGVRAFFADMLLFEKFDELAKDPVIFPYFNQEVAQALPEQMLRTITGHLLASNGDYRDLFTTPHSFMTRALGGLYKVQVHRSKGWEPYDFAANDDRAGILGQAGFLAIYSQSGRSSPTLRGRAIRELLMCQPVPNPPGNVNFTAVQDVTNKAMPTARVRLSAHANDSNCSSCHNITDPAGLSLERFDGIGAWRTSENGAMIDPAGMIDGKAFQGAAGLGKLLAGDPATTQCVAGRALQYASAKSSDEAQPLVAAIEQRFAAKGYTIRALFQIALTMPETWAVSARPLDQATHVTMAARR